MDDPGVTRDQSIIFFLSKPMHVWSILLAAGSGERLNILKQKKQFFLYKEKPLYLHSATTFTRVPAIKGIVFVFPSEDINSRAEELKYWFDKDNIAVEYKITSGGSSRQKSVYQGLMTLPPECDAVLIHDASRPFVSARLIRQVINSLEQGAQAVVPAVAVSDTIKQMQGNKAFTLNRNSLYAVQTPQGFLRKNLYQAHLEASRQENEYTDDSALVENMGSEVMIISGEEENTKITHPSDLRLLSAQETDYGYCIGWGYDVHRFGPGRELKLGGIPITGSPEVIAHSDGDVLLHAIADALLGCLGLGDIGDWFPDSDPRLENISSSVLLSEILENARRRSFLLEHLDLTIICEIPKLKPWKDQIRKNLINLLSINPEQLNLKATTEEGMGFTGEKKGIKAVALITGRKKR